MEKQNEVQSFLNDFKIKMGIWGVVFRDDRGKNAQTILNLEISTEYRKQVLRELVVDDFCEGPISDTLYGQSYMWVFGKTIKKKEVYIKITMGINSCPVICISFHESERKLKYHFK